MKSLRNNLFCNYVSQFPRGVRSAPQLCLAVAAVCTLLGLLGWLLHAGGFAVAGSLDAFFVVAALYVVMGLPDWFLHGTSSGTAAESGSGCFQGTSRLHAAGNEPQESAA